MSVYLVLLMASTFGGAIMSRTRSRVIGGGTAQASMSGQTKWAGETEPTDQTATTDYGLESTTQTTIDVVTPEFQKRINQGEVINNDFFSETITEVPAQPTSYSRDYRFGTIEDWTGAHWSGKWPLKNDDHLGGYLDPFIADPDLSSTIESLRQQALTTAHSNASSGEMQTLVTAAESGKTVNSLADILGRAIRILKAARRLDLKRVAGELNPKELADRYMELRYALRPLVYDANDLLAALEESRSYKNSRQTYRGYGRYSNSYEDDFPLGNYTDASGTICRTCSVEVDVRCGVLADVVTSGVSIWGADQLAETAWEITPFSFIADWFWNIGEKIAAFSPSAGVRELASWSTTIVKLDQRNWLDSITSTKNSEVYDLANSLTHSGQKTRKIKTVTRVADPNLSIYPQVKLRVDGLKLLDLAIIVSKFR